MQQSSSPHDPHPAAQDVVLGGQRSRPNADVVLGGLDGVRQRIHSLSTDQRLRALAEALNHGTAGLDLVILALEDPVEQVRHQAYQLLKDSSDEAIQHRLAHFQLNEVKQQLSSPVAEHRINALASALILGDEGLNLVIRTLHDPDHNVQQAAFRLLKDSSHPKATPALALFSSQGINYTPLRNLLSQGNWRLADQETRNLVYLACGLNPAEISQFPNLDQLPCDDLRLLDHLWTKHSQGHFGFSIQRPLWEHCHRTYWNKSIMWSAFGDRVGWRVNHLLRPNHWKRYTEITFSLEAPVGHLPFLGDRFGIFTIEDFARRLRQCE